MKPLYDDDLTEWNALRKRAYDVLNDPPEAEFMEDTDRGKALDADRSQGFKGNIVNGFFTFGKYKGQKLTDAPTTYLNWLIDNHSDKAVVNMADREVREREKKEQGTATGVRPSILRDIARGIVPVGPEKGKSISFVSSEYLDKMIRLSVIPEVHEMALKELEDRRKSLSSIHTAVKTAYYEKGFHVDPHKIQEKGMMLGRDALGIQIPPDTPVTLDPFEYRIRINEVNPPFRNKTLTPIQKDKVERFNEAYFGTYATPESETRITYEDVKRAQEELRAGGRGGRSYCPPQWVHNSNPLFRAKEEKVIFKGDSYKLKNKTTKLLMNDPYGSVSRQYSLGEPRKEEVIAKAVNSMLRRDDSPKITFKS